MAQNNTTVVAPERGRGVSAGKVSEGRPRLRRQGGGLLKQYKQDQGKNTRVGTFIGLGLLIVWGAWVLYNYLKIYEGDEFWRLLITRGVPIVFAIVLGSAAWWVAFANRASSDFMIATEGEMKKVSWSTKREVIGSTKVVILFTFLFAALLFVVDLAFQTAFKWIGVLKI
jgi:preprotein translocase subunit SecE